MVGRSLVRVRRDVGKERFGEGGVVFGRGGLEGGGGEDSGRGGNVDVRDEPVDVGGEGVVLDVGHVYARDGNDEQESPTVEIRKRGRDSPGSSMINVCSLGSLPKYLNSTSGWTLVSFGLSKDPQTTRLPSRTSLFGTIRIFLSHPHLSGTRAGGAGRVGKRRATSIRRPVSIRPRMSGQMCMSLIRSC
jgi:hypothetical protein